MARYKDTVWILNEDIDAGDKGMERRAVAALMDIRDELKQLNTLLGCRNFIDIPKTLRAIQRNTTKAK